MATIIKKANGSIELRYIDANGKRWDATKLGTQLATDVFKTRTPGLRY